MSPVSQGVFPPGRHTGRRMAVMGCLLLQVGVSAQPHHGCHSLSNGTHMPAPPGPFCNNPSIGGLDRAIQHFLYLPGLRQESGELRADDGLCPGRRPHHPGTAGGGRRGGGEHLRLPAVRLRGGHRQHSGDGGAEAGWPGTEDPGHRLHDPAVQAGRSERAAGGGRHSGHRQLRRYLRRHRRGDGGLRPAALPPGQHPHRPPGRGTHPVHAPPGTRISASRRDATTTAPTA